jgi:hypothetical protein
LSTIQYATHIDGRLRMILRRMAAVLLALAITAALAAPFASEVARADDWSRVARGGFQPGYNNTQGQAACSVEYDGSLYVGTRNLTGCQIWRYDGSSWTELISDGFGDGENRAATSMAVYNGNLFVGTYRQSGHCQVWRFDGASWAKVSNGTVETATNTTVSSMAAFSGRLVVGTGNLSGCGVLAYDGAAWVAQTTDGWANASNVQASSMAVYDGYLFVGTQNYTDGCEVHRWDGTSPWTTPVGGAGVPHGFGETNNADASAMAVWTDTTSKLWVGTRNDTSGAAIWTYDSSADTWALSSANGIDNPNNHCVTSLCAYDNGGGPILWAGTENDTQGCEVYRNLGGWSNEIGSGLGSSSYGFGDPYNRSVISMALYGTVMVAGTSQGLYGPDSGCQVWQLSTGTWSQINQNGFAPNSQDSVSAMATVSSTLYAGTHNPSTGGKVWRFNGTSWSQMSIPGFSYHNKTITCMLADGARLWIATRNDATGGEVWMYDGSWHMKIGPTGGGGDISLGPDNFQVSSMAILSGIVWLGTGNMNGCEVWYNDSPGNWGKSVDTGLGDATNTDASSMCVFSGHLYMGTWRSNGCCVFRYNNDGSWTQMVGPTASVGPGFGNDRNRQGSACAVWNSSLYFGTYNSNDGCEVWGYNGATWARSIGGGMGDARNESVQDMAALNGRLYACTSKYPGGGYAGEVWMANAAGWNQVSADGFGNPSNSMVTALASVGNFLFAGTFNRQTGCEVYAGTATPAISSVSPSSARAGDTVTVSGINFGTSRGGSYVSIGSTRPAEYTMWSDSAVRFKVPPCGAGTFSVSVTTSAGTSNQADLTVSTPVWYLAEGSSSWGFDTYVTIENPNAQEVTARVTYMTSGGPVSRPNLALPPSSQTTINPRDDIGEKDFSTRVECLEKMNIAVDRRMVWTGAGARSQEGHCSVGVTAPAKTWYLAEGSSKWGFECWLLIQNPNNVDATCQVTYMVEGGAPLTVLKTVGANERDSFNIADDIGKEDASIMISSDQPVIPERAMYRNNRREGHDSIGTDSPASSFYLAEGTSAWGFTTYVLVQNPNTADANVTVTYMTNEGPRAQPSFVLPKKSRKTIRVNDVLPSMDFSTLVNGDRPIIAERAMYWDNGTGEACHDSIGMSGAHRTFYLPDGETYNAHETFTLVQNPNATAVAVQIRYLTNGETANQEFTATIAPNSRQTFNMADRIPAGRAAVLVTCKTSGKKIMVERAMYWSSRGAGTDTIGGYSD